VAGLFYPDDPKLLHRELQRFLHEAPGGGELPKAIIVPHAGYVYSGPVAASAYARLTPARGRIERVVLLGPSHRVAFRGLSVPSCESYETPFGRIALDREAIAELSAMPQVVCLDAAHAHEHSLEVHLPFLQEVLGEFSLVPLVVGEASAEDVAAVLECVWEDAATLVVVSTDLSHYLDYDTARRVDRATCTAIERLRFEDIGRDTACGRVPLAGLLCLARRRGLRVTTLDLRNSGDTAGDRDRVVGYGAWLLA
jgi:AmmeMemoRadiSam system protein B